MAQWPKMRQRQVEYCNLIFKWLFSYYHLGLYKENQYALTFFPVHSPCNCSAYCNGVGECFINNKTT